MIFQHTIDKVLSGRKTQTRRLQLVGDWRGTHHGARAVLRADGRPRWVVGRTYAVQRSRTAKGERGVRVLVMKIRFNRNPLRISTRDAAAEGFPSPAKFRQAWKDLHRKRAHYPAWVICFRLIESNAEVQT